MLCKFDGFVSDLIKFIKEQAKINEGNIIKIRSIPSKRYLLSILKSNIIHFIKENFLNTLLKVYCMDENAGIYSDTLKFIIFAYSIEECKEYFIKENFIDNLLDYLNTVITTYDSIYLLRKLEIILAYMSIMYPNNTPKSEMEMEKMFSDFIKYDLLTQLAFLETIEQDINKEDILMIGQPIKNFFNENIMSLPEEVLRKLLFTFSKFYARNILTKEIKLVKNTLAISFQYYDDTKRTDFICPIILNVFNNENIYTFLMDSANNVQFEFLNRINDIIVENYIKSDPHIKMDLLEIFAKIFLYKESNWNMQESYINELLRILYKNNKGKDAKNDNEAISDFVDGLYNDFKRFDLPDYEVCFLQCVHCMILNKKLSQLVLSNFELVLYLLNRREKPKEVCMEKYNLIKDIVNKSDLIKLMSKEFASQFEGYMSKGPY